MVPGVAPSPPPPSCSGEGDARGLWAGTVVGAHLGCLPWPGSCLWSRGQALKIQPKSNFNKVWKPSLGDTRALPREVRRPRSSESARLHPCPSKPARLPTRRPPGLTTDPPRGHCPQPGAQAPKGGPKVPLGGSHRTRGTRRGLSQPPTQPHSGPSWPRPASALWKQLLLEGLSIALFLQEINTPPES